MRAIFLCFIALLFITSCSVTKNNAPTHLNGRWELTVFPSAEKPFSELFSQHTPQIEFNGENEKVFGSTGCNRFNTTYVVNGSNITFDENILLTKMACPDYDENLFINNLLKVNKYRKGKNELQLLQNNDLIMTFTKKTNP